ncbi:MAG: hypothetical protein IPG49_07290 [Proteobacteria bacterium]|nr:hypothetical protein [Pseudomonadota bacterium]
MHEEPKEIPAEDEGRLRASLEQLPSGASAAHDEVILAAAGKAAQDIQRRRKPHAWRLPLALAAGLAAATLATLLHLQGTWMPGDTLRGGDSGMTITPAPGATIADTPPQLAWAAVPGAERYEVVLRDAAGGELGRGTTAAASIAFGELTDTRLPAGSYFWSIRAQGPALDRELGPFHFRVSPSP